MVFDKALITQAHAHGQGWEGGGGPISSTQLAGVHGMGGCYVVDWRIGGV